MNINLEQGPRSSGHTRGNELVEFSLNYQPEKFGVGSYFRLMFGDKPLSVTLRDIYQYDTTHTTDAEGGEVLEIFIPIRGKVDSSNFMENSVQLLISRSTGKVFGYGPQSRNGTVAFMKDIWMRLRNTANANRRGRGIWSNDLQNSEHSRLADGIYRGFGPTDESAMMLGEVELVIKGNVAHVRMATGHQVEEGEMDLIDKEFKMEGEDIFLYTGGMTDMISPLILRRYGVDTLSDFEKLVDEMESHFGKKGALPRLSHGGRAPNT